MRVAAVDCGTNSIRLLVADRAADGGLSTVERRMEIVRLGQDVDRTGAFAAEALERTFAACDRYADVIAAYGVERTRFVATSASRDVSNRDAFVDGVRARLGIEPEVVTGAEEARLSFVGATSELASTGLPRPYLVADIGGGSTELVLGAEEPEAEISLDVGSVRLTERYLAGDPPTEDKVAAARKAVDAALDDAERVVPLTRARTLVGLAGSVSTLAAMVLDLPEYDAGRIHRARMPAPDVRRDTARLVAMTRDERRALPYMHPGRADVIGGGVLVLERILARVEDGLGDGVLVSEQDVLDGIALSVT